VAFPLRHDRAVSFAFANQKGNCEWMEAEGEKRFIQEVVTGVASVLPGRPLTDRRRNSPRQSAVTISGASASL
jgi:hypothetical protein